MGRHATTRLTPRHSAVALLGVALVVSCSRSRPRDGDPVTVTATATDSNSRVDVVGLDGAVFRRLARLAPNDTAWVTWLAVYVDRGQADASAPELTSVPPTPPVIGRYTISGDSLRFEPRFPFEPGVSYQVRVDTAALRLANQRQAEGRLTRDLPLVSQFSRPKLVRPRTTRVVGLYPSSAHVPSNLLRWYVEFSAPMEPGSALSHVRLLDASGREVIGAFLALDQELWDPERRRLTLLFDPGRVKRGVRTNVEMGAPLVAGRRYRLVIDNGWPDGTGATLASGYEHDFDVTPADRRSPDPGRWRLTIPAAGSDRPLVVGFGEILDHALASRSIAVYDPRGDRVLGSVMLAGDSVWRFAPEREWAPGDYSLRVNAMLEDVAGNNLARVFDKDMMAAPNAVTSTTLSDSVRTVKFRVQD